MPAEVVRTRFQWRRDTAANWTSVNPVLLDGEPGLEADTGKIKYGDGVTAWNGLAYASGGTGATNLSVTARTGTSLTVASDSGTDAVIPAASGTEAGLLTATQHTKLAGIASGATANSADANLLDRANHTGTQAAGTITGLATVATTGAYGDLSSLPTLGTAAATDATAYATASEGVTNGNSHDHSGGDGAQIAYSSLSGLPTIPAPADAAPQPLGATAAIGSSTDYAREDHVHQRDSDVIVIPVGDESTALTTGTGKIKFRMPFAATLLAVKASVNTAPTDSTLIVDINEAGTSVLGTKLSIDAGELTSTTAASPATITDSSLADDAEISIDIDQIGSTVAGAGLKVSMFVRRA